MRLVLPRNDGRSKVRFDPNRLTRIILGRNMSEDRKNHIREWATQRRPELTVLNAYYDPVERTIKLREH